MGKKRNYDYGADSVLMSDEDYNKLEQYKSDFDAASQAGNRAGMQAAHDGAELLRARYGYSGGSDGSGYQKLGQTQGKPYTSKLTAPEYTSRYQDLIDSVSAQVLGRDAFRYDAQSDPLYQQYESRYQQAGSKAMEDTLAQISARTGGLASSYAGTAAQQTYDQYMSQLNDKIPELQQLAYSMYVDEGERLEDRLNTLVGLENADYNKYLNQLDRYNQDREFEYGVFADEQEWDYQNQKDARDQQAQLASLAEGLLNLGIPLNEEQLAALNMDGEQAAMWETAAREALEQENGQDQRAQQAAIGEYLLSMGVPLNQQQLAALELDPEQAEQVLAQIREQGESEFTLPDTQEELFRMLYNAGVTTAEGAKAQLALWGVSSPGNYTAAFTQWFEDNKNTLLPEGDGFSTDRNVDGVKASEWDSVKNTIQMNLREGNFAAVESYLDKVADGMSQEQWNELVEILKVYPYFEGIE